MKKLKTEVKPKNKLPKRHFFNEKHYFIDYENRKVILEKEFHNLLLKKKLWGNKGFKKITGSSLGDVLETDNFKSKFNAFLKITRLDMPVLDYKYINAGKKIEPLFLELISKKINKKIKVFPPEKYNFDYFLKVDEIVGGIPDGYIEDQKIILEIKTTSIKNIDKWKKSPPLDYIKQAQLYTFLNKTKKFIICAVFLEDKDYVAPENLDIYQKDKENKINFWNYEINQFQVLDEVNKIKNWYREVTQKGESPRWKYNLNTDLKDFLECKDENEWEKLWQKWEQEGKINIY